MIPSDLATRLRVLMDTEVRNLAPIHEIPTDLPDLETGQRFAARLQSPLPDGTFQALVAGRTVTLALPAGVKSGDVLELVVTGTRGQTILARPADTSELAHTTAPETHLSAAGQLISQVLTGRGGNTAAQIQRNTPVVETPPNAAAALAPALKQAISQSGLFYEAHQAQWVEGQLPLESLMQEPQGQTPPAAPPGQAAQTPTGNIVLPHVSLAHAETAEQTPTGPTTLLTRGKEAELAAATHEALSSASPSATASSAANQQSALRIAETLMPIIHQQLDALATRQINWQGELWPGQFMQWTIIDPEGEQAQDQGDARRAPEPWQSQLRLSMPGLGDLDAQLVLTPSGVAIRISAASAASADTLQARSEALGSALDAAGVPLTGLVIHHGT